MKCCLRNSTSFSMRKGQVRHAPGLKILACDQCGGFSSNLTIVGDSCYPDGIGAEMFDFSLLADARERHTDVRQREHVQLNFFDYTVQ